MNIKSINIETCVNDHVITDRQTDKFVSLSVCNHMIIDTCFRASGVHLSVFLCDKLMCIKFVLFSARLCEYARA